MQNSPKIDILGVYRLPITEELIGKQAEILYGKNLSKAQFKNAHNRCKEQLNSTVLIELLVTNCDEHFSVNHFTQPREGLTKG
jgi:hypothetical protein